MEAKATPIVRNSKAKKIIFITLIFYQNTIKLIKFMSTYHRLRSNGLGVGNLSLMAFERRLDRLKFSCDNYSNT